MSINCKQCKEEFEPTDVDMLVSYQEGEEIYYFCDYACYYTWLVNTGRMNKGVVKDD